MGFKQVSISSALIPMVRAVPRGLTATVDAYLTPVIKEYLSGFLSGTREWTRLSWVGKSVYYGWRVFSILFILPYSSSYAVCWISMASFFCYRHRSYISAISYYLWSILFSFSFSNWLHFGSGFDEGLDKVSVSFMQSDGGLTPESRFSGHKVRILGIAILMLQVLSL